MKIKFIPLFTITGSLLLAAIFNTVSAQTYCTASNTSSTSYYIKDVTTTGGVTDISNTGTGFSSSGYGDYTNMSASAIQGNSLTLTCAGGPSGYTYMWNIWIDWNHDGDFDDPGENIFTQSSYVNSITTTIAVPLTAIPGDTRLRIRDAYISPPPPACGGNIWGEAEDYTFTVIPLAPPDNAGVDSLVSPGISGIFCSGTQDVSVRLRNLGSNSLNSVQVNWSVDGVLRIPVTYSQHIDSIASPDNWAIVDLGQAQFPYNTPVTIRSWTSMPNGVADNDNSDDTLTQVVTSIKQGIIMHIQPQDTTICTGVSVTLDAGAFPSGPLYVWSTGAITRTINVTDAGDYYVKVMNATGCEARDTVHVTVNPSPSAAAVSAIDLGGGDFSFGVIAAEHVDTYQWNFGDGSAPQSGPPPMAHHYTTAGVYAVTLTLINDCGGITISKQVNVEQGTGIADINALKAAISMYPNPAQDQVTLQAKDGLKINTVAFYDLLGRKIYAATVNDDKALVNTTALPAGFYQVVIDTDKGRTSKKLAIGK